jgi:hypothetical protein
MMAFRLLAMAESAGERCRSCAPASTSSTACGRSQKNPVDEVKENVA